MTLTYLLDLFRSSKKDDEIYWEGYRHGQEDYKKLLASMQLGGPD